MGPGWCDFGAGRTDVRRPGTDDRLTPYATDPGTPPGAAWRNPQGYGYRFDTLAKVLVSVLGVADDRQRARVDAFIVEEGIVPDDMALLPAFYPVIEPVDGDWKDLQMSFSYAFKNQPYEFHNAGMWPMVTGFYVADLAARGKRKVAQRYLAGIHRANALPMDGEVWSFPEYVDGRTFTAGGTRNQGWSAAAAVIGLHALEGTPLLRGNDHD